MAAVDQRSIYTNVQEHYGRAARESNNSSYGQTVASAFGYSAEELKNAPSESNLGLSCGNPFALANLREGETVIDLGSGAGFDVFQAAKKVGMSGKVYGVDMNEVQDAFQEKELITHDIKEKFKADNTSFIKSQITAIDLPNTIADCIISNCVVNLVPTMQKHLVFKEMFRLLKPGGRIAISDILLKKPLTEALRNDVALYVGCIAGASKVEEYEEYLKKAGFEDVLLVPDNSDLNIYKTADQGFNEAGCCGPASTAKSSCCGSGTTKPMDGQPSDTDLNEWAGSYKHTDAAGNHDLSTTARSQAY
ncbi:MAG: hypothetical protein Q9222_005239 [Ikaeria aurantiellina]